MSYELYVARRYMQSKQRSGFLSVITFIAVGGVIVGVAALVIMLSVANGFSGEVKNRLIGMHAHVRVERFRGPVEDADSLQVRLAALPQVAATTSIIEAKLVLATDDDEFDGVFVWGIDPETFGRVSDMPQHLKYDGFHFDDYQGGEQPGIVLGTYLANRLGVGLGDRVLLLSFRNASLEDVMMGGVMPKLHPFVVTNLFESGMYQYDDGFAFISQAKAQQILGLDGVTAVQLKLHDVDDATAVREAVNAELGYPFRARDWTQEFPELFQWMELEKWVIFIALSLIILVAAFNITSILTMSILVKTPEIGILRAMGAGAASIRRVFLYQGLFIGVFGTLLGGLLGTAVCLLQDRFHIISIPSDIYIISSLPVDMQPLDLVLIAAVSVSICLLAAVIPARRAASLQPVDAIRFIM